MYIRINMFKEKMKLNYYKKKTYNFLQNQSIQKTFEQQQKSFSLKRGNKDNLKSPLIYKRKKKNFEIIGQKFKSFRVKKIFFKSVLIKLCQFRRENSRFQCFISFEAILFISKALDLKFSLLFFESFLIFLKFRKDKFASFFSLTYYSLKLKDRKIKFCGKNLFFVGDIFPKKSTLTRRKLIGTRFGYNLKNYFNESNTVNLIYGRWIIYKKYFRFKKILKTSLLFIDNNKTKFFRGKDQRE